MPAATTDKISKVSSGVRPVSTTVSTIRNSGATTLACADLTGWTTTEAVYFVTYKVDGQGDVVAGSQSDWKGIVSGSNINNLTLTGGADAGNAAGDIVEMLPTAEYAKQLGTHLLTEHKQDGTHSAITATSINATTATFTSLTVGSQTPSADWTASVAPNTVTYNGNRSYTLVNTGTDLTGVYNPGTRERYTRTVAAPTQSTSLDGVTNYWNKTSPNKLSATNNITLDIEFELLSYPSVEGTLASLYTSAGGGWTLGVNSTGQMFISGLNGGSVNRRSILSYESVALGKSYRLTSQLDMATWTTTATTNYMMLNGADINVQLTQAGSNPTSLTPTGALEIGSQNGGTLKANAIIKQFAFFNAKVTQATMRTYHSQSYVGNETSLQTAYNFNGNGNDLNTTTPNNLTAQGGATATFARNAFGMQGSGSVSSILDYAITQSCVFSGGNTTRVVQVPEGCTIPTSGGITAVSYSSAKAPYGFPIHTGKWRIESIYQTSLSASFGAVLTWTGSFAKLNYPLGSWKYGYEGAFALVSTVAGQRSGFAVMVNSTPTNNIYTYPTTARIYNIAGAYYAVTLSRASHETYGSAGAYTFYASIQTATGTETFTLGADNVPFVMYIENPYL